MLIAYRTYLKYYRKFGYEYVIYLSFIMLHTTLTNNVKIYEDEQIEIRVSGGGYLLVIANGGGWQNPIECWNAGTVLRLGVIWRGKQDYTHVYANATFKRQWPSWKGTPHTPKSLFGPIEPLFYALIFDNVFYPFVFETGSGIMKNES